MSLMTLWYRLSRELRFGLEDLEGKRVAKALQRRNPCAANRHFQKKIPKWSFFPGRLTCGEAHGEGRPPHLVPVNGCVQLEPALPPLGRRAGAGALQLLGRVEVKVSVAVGALGCEVHVEGVPGQPCRREAVGPRGHKPRQCGPRKRKPSQCILRCVAQTGGGQGNVDLIACLTFCVV